MEVAPQLQLRLGEAREVGVPRKLDRLRLRREGLHDHLPRPVAAAGATRHLHEELEGALVGPEVRDVHRDVGIHQAHERDIGEVEPLADHLRADQDIDLAGAKLAEHLAEAVLLRHRVGVHPLDPRPREHPADRLLDALRAEALPPDLRRAAGRAGQRRRPRLAAQVAPQRLVGAVIGHRDAAVRAFFHVPALSAEHRGRVTAPVDEEDCLLLALEAKLHRIGQLA